MFGALVDFEALVSMYFALPLLEELNRFIKMCQLRDIFILDLLSDLKGTCTRIARLYTDPDSAFKGAAFNNGNDLLKVRMAWFVCFDLLVHRGERLNALTVLRTSL